MHCCVPAERLLCHYEVLVECCDVFSIAFAEKEVIAVVSIEER